MTITGASSGIGQATAAALYLAGANVVVAARSRERGELAIASARGRVEAEADRLGNLTFMALDLADLRSVEQFAHDVQRDISSIDGARCGCKIISNMLFRW